MARLCVCIEPFYKGLPSHEKIKKIAEIGYSFIEFWFWDHEFDANGLSDKKKDIEKIATLVKELKIEVSDIVVNSPDGSIGGSLNRPEERQKYLARLEETIGIAKKIGCKKLITCSGNKIENIDIGTQLENTIATLKEAVKIAGNSYITLLLEALNSKVDHKGYLVDSSSIGFEIVRRVNSPYLKLLYDIYHMQIMEGNIISTIEQNINMIGHFHSAGVPGRNELDSGELDYRNIIKKVDEMGYNGSFGLEYFPLMESEESLKKLKKFLNS